MTPIFYILTMNQQPLFAPQENGVTIFPIFIDTVTAKSFADKHPAFEVDEVSPDELDQCVTMAT